MVFFLIKWNVGKSHQKGGGSTQSNTIRHLNYLNFFTFRRLKPFLAQKCSLPFQRVLSLFLASMFLPRQTFVPAVFIRCVFSRKLDEFWKRLIKQGARPFRFLFSKVFWVMAGLLRRAARPFQFLDELGFLWLRKSAWLRLSAPGFLSLSDSFPFFPKYCDIMLLVLFSNK